MQLKKPASIKLALAAASNSLLAASNNASAQSEAEWQVDSAVLLYSETDRVSAFEPVVSARKQVAEDEFVAVRLVLDALTGASANGAIASDEVQTFTTPSGNGTYVANPGETPLDPSFHDTRGALNVSWERPLTARLKSTYGMNISKEFDYRSLSVSASFTKDVNERNTSLSAAFSLGSDFVNPVGGIPVPTSLMPTSTSQAKQVADADDTKTLYDFMFGVTQVISRRTLAQFNLSYGVSDGYLTDPYKIVSVVEDDPANVNGNALGDVLRHVYESRPQKRVSQSLYTKWVHQLKLDVINVSYRYFWDDWGLDSHTVDFHYRYEINPQYYLQPHLRYYQQSAADFYRYFITDGETPEHVSADYRLGDMTTTTIGLLMGRVYSPTSQLTMRIELMTQSGEGHPSEAIGKVQQQDLFPDVTAYIIQVGYSLVF